MKGFRWLGVLVGFALLAWILYDADLPAVWKQVESMSWRFGIIFIFYIVIFGLDTIGWQYTFHPGVLVNVSLAGLFRARLSGEAVNYFTPTAWIGGEPVKAYLLKKRYGVPTAEGMASVVIAKMTFSFSMFLFIITGLIVTGFTQKIFNPELFRWVWLILPVFAVLLTLFFIVQFLKPFQKSVLLLKLVSPERLHSIGAKVHEWDQAIKMFYRNSPKDVFLSIGLHFLGWAAGALEVYLILDFLGTPVSLSTAWSIEALWVLLKTGAFLIPASIGASEGFLLLICIGLGIDTVLGLALALIRRAREIGWMGLGLFDLSSGWKK